MPSSREEIESLFDALPNRRRAGKLERWLKDDEARAKRFWEFVEIGQSRDHSIEDILSLWAKHYPPCPVGACRIRERLRERTGRS